MTGFAENMVQAGTDTLGSVPGQAVQVVSDGVIAVFVGNNPNDGGNLLFACQPIGFFQIQEQIVHIILLLQCFHKQRVKILVCLTASNTFN